MPGRISHRTIQRARVRAQKVRLLIHKYPQLTGRLLNSAEILEGYAAHWALSIYGENARDKARGIFRRHWDMAWEKV